MLLLFFFLQLQRGLEALQQNHLLEARQILEQAAQQDPKNSYIWTSLAQTYLKLNLPTEALAAAGKAEKTGHDNPITAHALALFYSETGNADKALTFARQALKQSPTPANQHLLSDISFADAQALMRRQQFAQASEILESALTANPQDPQLTLALGVARYGQRRFEEAQTEFLKVIAIDPSLEQPYNFLGRMLDQAGPHLPEIQKVYGAWVAREPANARALLLLAEVLLTQNHRDTHAEPLLRKSIALNDHDWESHYQLGLVLAAEHHYDEAAAEFTRSIALAPQEPLPHYHLAQTYDRLNKPEQAQAERDIHKQLTEKPH